LSDKPKILVVDDEMVNCRLLEKFLENEFEVKYVLSGEECLDSVNEFSPDVFLLDVSMPGGMDGFELCEKIRNQPSFNNSLIIFLSALDSLEKKINGYKVGGDDYITKPIELEVLSAKLKTQLERITTAASSSNEALSMAMTAMTNGSEIGQVNLFLEKLQDVNSYKELGNQLITTCHEFGVNAVAQIRLPDENINLSTTGIVNAFEDELMLMARRSERIFSFGKRCLFNFNGATLLVRVMPEDSDEAGRYRDHLASVMNGVEARIRSLNIELTLNAQNKSLVINTLQETDHELSEIVSLFKKHDQSSIHIIDNLISEMHLAFSYLNLDEEQEEYLLTVVKKSMGKMAKLSSASLDLDQRFESVTTNLKKVLSPQEG